MIRGQKRNKPFTTCKRKLHRSSCWLNIYPPSNTPSVTPSNPTGHKNIFCSLFIPMAYQNNNNKKQTQLYEYIRISCKVDIPHQFPHILLGILPLPPRTHTQIFLHPPSRPTKGSVEAPPVGQVGVFVVAQVPLAHQVCGVAGLPQLVSDGWTVQGEAVTLVRVEDVVLESSVDLGGGGCEIGKR